MEVTSSMFVAADYVVLLGMLTMTISIGIYYAVIDRKKNNIKNYNFGGKTMSPIPVGFSAAVSFVSAITVIGFPSELYYFGTVCIWYTVQTILANVVSCVYYIPLVFRLQISSIFEYLELRFHKRNRRLCSVNEIIKTIFYIGTSVYLPALALNAVAPIRIDVAIVLISALCTVYTTIGGLKAVIWTDTLQSLIMLAGLLATSIQLIILVGGFGNIYLALDRSGRLNTFYVDFDPTVQRTFLSLLIGKSLGGLTYITFSQTTMQRYMSCKSIKKAREASIFSNIPSLFFMGLGMFSGAAMYAYYEGCDPVESGQVAKRDQLMSFTVGEIFKFLPGMNGLFVSSVFGASFSTVSSGINSIAMLVVEDFVSPFHPNMGSKKKVFMCKTIAVIVGMLVAVIGVSINLLSNTTVVPIIGGIFGATGGPVIAVFILGSFFPWCNSIGAYVGQIVGTVVGFWAILSATFYGIPPEKLLSLPTSVDQCESGIFNSTSMLQSNFTEMYFTTPLTTTATAFGFKELTFPIWGLSFTYIVILGFIISFSVGLLVSFATGANNPRNSNPDYFLPIFDNPRLPLKVRTFFRFGVPEKSNEKSKQKFSVEEEETMIAAEERNI